MATKCRGAHLAALAITVLPGTSAASKSNELAVTVSYAAPDACRASFGSTTFLLPSDRDAFVAALKPLRRKYRNVAVVPQDEDVIYRCIGTAVFLSQMAGFKKANFVSKR